MLSLRRLGNTVLPVIAGVLLVLGISVVGATAAFANTDEQCGNAGSGYCLNDLSYGDNVGMWNGGYSNDNFALINVAACNGGDYITSACASSWGSSGSQLVGALMFRIQYQDGGSYDGDCVGTGNGGAVLTACGDSQGNGAGNGVIMAYVSGSGCASGGGRYEAVDRYWSKSNNALTFLNSGGSKGSQAVFFDGGGQTCWGNTSGA